MTGTVTTHSPPEAKIALFRSLFRGRDHVYPRRFESRRTGHSGYQPACAHQWARGLCDKPRTKCSDCSNRRLLPVTDEVVRWHLSGQDDRGRAFVMGVYPMLLDETCFFLAADFDGAAWQADVGAFLETCRRLALAGALWSGGTPLQPARRPCAGAGAPSRTCKGAGAAAAAPRRRRLRRRLPRPVLPSDYNERDHAEAQKGNGDELHDPLEC
jgi:hypothetical protein